MGLIGGLNRDTTDDLLTRVRVASVAMLLLGGLFGGVLIHFWPTLAAPGPLEQRLIFGGVVAAPLLFAFIVYLYLTLGVVRALRERFANLKRAAEAKDTF